MHTPANVEQIIATGMDLGKGRRFADAEAMFRRALELAPDHPAAHRGLGMALKEQDRWEPAVESLRRAVELAPRDAQGYVELGLALMKLNRAAETIDLLRRAIAVDPQAPEPHGLLSKALLLTGDFKRGWAEYEWRWKCRGMEPQRRYATPRWTGAQPVKGKTVLLYHEQGFGDTIQFARYGPLLADRGADVILEVPPELVSLMRRLPGSPDVIPLGAHPPRFDLHAPLMSLPLAFNTTPKTVPARVPYLSVPKAAADVWAERVRETDAPGEPAPLRVGIAWGGRPTHVDNRQRTMPLSNFSALAGLHGVTFYSLQKWDPGDEAKSPPPGLRFVDAAPRLFDFADTAALIANLDLVLTVDTAVAHVAGATGKPAWVMLPFAPDFRWMFERSDSPWYPTLRLFRQPAPGDWAPVFAAVRRELAALAPSAASGHRA